MNHPVIFLAWVLGTFSGALWIAALEREDYKSARLFGRYMLFCYVVCLLGIALTESFS